VPLAEIHAGELEIIFPNRLFPSRFTRFPPPPALLLPAASLRSEAFLPNKIESGACWGTARDGRREVVRRSVPEPAAIREKVLENRPRACFESS